MNGVASMVLALPKYFLDTKKGFIRPHSRLYAIFIALRNQ
jgi:hypothetical protein